jgi:hypothetical protein
LTPGRSLSDVGRIKKHRLTEISPTFATERKKGGALSVSAFSEAQGLHYKAMRREAPDFAGR